MNMTNCFMSIIVGFIALMFSVMLSVMLYVVFIALPDEYRHNEKYCQDTYGSNWHFQHRQAYLCVNEKGEIRY